MELTARQLNRATLDRQLLLRRERIGVVDAIRRVVGLQAQEPASPYVALWNRIEGFRPDELDRAFAEREVVKAPLMRITLHVVTAAEHPWFHEAMTPTLRAARLNDRRFRSTGVSVEVADELAASLVGFAAVPRGKDEVLAHLAERLGSEPEPGVWWALRTYAPLVHSPTGPPWSFGRSPRHEAAPRAARPRSDEALGRLIRRYLEGFGPASVDDLAQFTMLRKADLRPTLRRLGDELVHHGGPGGVDLLDVAVGELPTGEETAPPRLLGMWDDVLLAYADRSRVVPDHLRPHVIRRNGDVLPTVLVDGHVVGVWRPVDDGIEVTALEAIDDASWHGLEVEAASLLTVLVDRDPTMYGGRFANWWGKLPEPRARRVLRP